MGAVQENRPQLQLRRPAGREPLHNTSAAAALVVRDTPVVSRVPGVPSVPSVPRFTAVPQFVPNMADTAGALLRYAALMRRLDRWLDAPLVVKREANGHTVWLLDAVGYRVNRRTRTVYAVYHGRNGVRRGNFSVDLMAFLRLPFWLEFVVRRLGLSDSGAQGQLFAVDVQVQAEEQWLCQEAYRALRRDPRFALLQRERLPRALGLDPVLHAIALGAAAAAAGGHCAARRKTPRLRRPAGGPACALRRARAQARHLALPCVPRRALAAAGVARRGEPAARNGDPCRAARLCGRRPSAAPARARDARLARVCARAGVRR